MKVACLQFAPELGKVQQNIAKSNDILETTDGLNEAANNSPLWLVLPELAFTGYNFTGLHHIEPFLEPTTAGITTQWAQSTARKYRCYVTVGYPEKAAICNYNSTVTVSPAGIVVANYRKRFLYYTDETWAAEGDEKRTASGFFAGDIDGVSVAMGICMDINPHRFEAPWTKYEFANHVLESNTQLVILSMAWLTRLSQYELEESPLRPDNDTFAYWIERFYPLLGRPSDAGAGAGASAGGAAPVFLVLANRCGVENEVCYAGTSAVVSFENGRGYIYDMMGKYETRCMIVDLKQAPKYEIQAAAVS